MKNKLISVFIFLLILFCVFSAFFGTPEDGGQSIYDSMTVPVTEAVETPPEESQLQETTQGLPAGEANGAEAIVDAAYALSPGEYLDGTRTLTGTIVAVVDNYSEKYENITVEIVVEGCEDRPIQCFRLEGEGVDDLAEGDIITVSGQMMNYKGTVEFDAGCVMESVIRGQRPEVTEKEPSSNNDDSKDAVATYIHENGCLPEFYMTKNQAKRLYGWEGGALDNLAPGMCIGGDRFNNYEEQLPDAPGRYYTECDIGTIGNGARGAKRIVFSNDGLIFYTEDHYETFELLYGEP